MRGMTSWPFEVKRVTASGEMTSVDRVAHVSASAVTRDATMVGRPSSFRGSAMKPGRTQDH